MKLIKRRIKSVSSTMQITKAMELVSSSKLRRAKERAEAGRPFFEKQYELLSELAASKKDFKSVYTEKREVKSSLYIVISGDRGLAGGYNSNILKMALNDSKEAGNVKFIAIGKVAVEFFAKRGAEIVAEYPLLAENAKVADCGDIATVAAEMFKNGEVDAVRLYYTAFVSPLVQEPSSLDVLPVYKPESETAGFATPIHYDPSPEAVFGRMIPRFVSSLLISAVRESYASEQAARRNAMENATDNAEKMTEELSLRYNRARQEKITNEINEIVSGANALSN